MKMKQILLLVLCLALLLCGCSKGAPGDTFQGNHMEAPKGEDGLTGSNGASSAGGNVLADRKLIRRISISAEAEDMDAMLSDLSAHIATLGGYVESRNVHNGSAYSGNRYRTATLVIRIPADKLDGFVRQVEKSGNVVSTNETTDDVTLQYVDTQSRLKMLRTEEERLLKFLNDATSVSELLEVEKRLTQVQAEIESLTAQLKTYDNLVSYGTVTLNITEVETYTPTQQPGLWQRIKTAFRSSLTGLGHIFQALLVFFLGYSPYLLAYGLFLGGILLIIWAVWRRKRKKNENQNNPAQ